LSATTSGAIKAFLEAQGLGVTVYADKAPVNTRLVKADGTASPYVVVHEGIAVVPDKLEDGAASTAVEQIQVEVWMPIRNLQSGARLESTTLAQAVAARLIGSRLATAPKVVYGTLVTLIGPRLVTDEDNVVRVPITAEIYRVL